MQRKKWQQARTMATFATFVIVLVGENDSSKLASAPTKTTPEIPITIDATNSASMAVDDLETMPF
jgi:hypothetical protein